MKNILSLFISLFIFSAAHAATFTVTSNADSGPGTLRQALLDAAANGMAAKDLINFNLPDVSESGRTITLSSQLPDMTSNLVIDGSTQPGAKFGVSDARVKLFFQLSDQQKLSGLKAVGQDDIEIYGLYIQAVTTIANRQNTQFYYWNGIELKNDKRITIGAAEKGNVVLGFNNNIVINPSENVFMFFEDLTLKANFIGIDADGKTLSPIAPQRTLFSTLTGNIIIGGTEAEGNIFAYGLEIYQNNVNDYPPTDPQSYYSSAPTVTLIKNNKIGVDRLAQSAIPGTSGLSLLTGSPNGKTTYTVEDNVIIGDPRGPAFHIVNNGHPVYIRRNYIGTDKTRQYRFESRYGIFLSTVAKVFIGSNNPADANYITGNKPVHRAQFANASINKNSFYCTAAMSPMIDTFGSTNFVTTISITTSTPNSIIGKATPNSVIELFYADACGTCSPETFFASTMADANGDWNYNGPFLRKVIASATFNNSTSEFTGTTVDVSYLGIVHACSGNGGLGSILGAVPQNGATVQWLNESGTVVGTAPDLKNVPPGKYKLVLAGGDCNAETSYYEIKNVSMQMDATGMAAKDASCGIYNGSIKGLKVIRNTTDPLYYLWKNNYGVEAGKTLDVESLPPGSYTLTVSGFGNSCPITFGPVVIKDNAGPIIDQSSAIIVPSSCGQTTGSITGMTITGTGTIKYSWKNAAGTEVATTKDLIKQPAGVYTLQVTNDTQCGPVYTSAITITEINGVTIDDSQKQISKATCQNNDGSITGIKTTGAAIFKWHDSNNVVVSAQADLKDVKDGTYYLIASNANGCTAQSATYTITREAATGTSGMTKKLIDATCEKSDGSIEVIFTNPPANIKSYRWVNKATQVTVRITTVPKVTGIPGGSYDIYIAEQNGCERYLITYSIGNTQPFTIDTNGIQQTNDACNNGVGSVKGLKVTTAAAVTYNWRDANGTSVGNNIDLLNVKAGAYMLYVVTADNSCSKTYGPVNITNTGAPQIDPANAKITPTMCTQNTGSITGITATGTGTLTYSWKNAAGTVVANTKDLVNQPAGSYTLQVTDQGQCGPVTTTPFTIGLANPVVMDYTQQVITKAACNADNGSVTGIRVTGATSYAWYNQSHQLMSTQIDLKNAPPGTYYLYARNNQGCDMESKLFTITRETTDWGGTTKFLKDAGCDLNNGSIEVILQHPPAVLPKSYRWVSKATQQTIGTTPGNTTSSKMTGLDAGTYDIYATDQSGCEGYLVSYSILRIPNLSVYSNTVTTTDETCGNSNGSIKGIGAAGLAPVTYTWTDQAGKVVGNSIDLVGVKAGTYSITVADGLGCAKTLTYTIKNSNAILATPASNIIQLCSPGTAFLSFPTEASLGYRLYETANAASAIAENATGKFQVKVPQSRSYYISKYSGNCESARAEVKITVGVGTMNLANTFSPNGDGINDTWRIPNIENYPKALVQIFNRNGDLLFNSIGYGTPFDGTYKGRLLPTGAYYYVINLNSGCNLLSGNLTIVR